MSIYLLLLYQYRSCERMIGDRSGNPLVCDRLFVYLAECLMFCFSSRGWPCLDRSIVIRITHNNNKFIVDVYKSSVHITPNYYGLEASSKRLFVVMWWIWLWGHPLPCGSIGFWVPPIIIFTLCCHGLGITKQWR